MNGQFRGKRLFGGRLFAVRLFGPPERAAVIGGGGRLRMRVPEQLLDQRIDEDDVLLLIAAAYAAGSGLLQ